MHEAPQVPNFVDGDMSESAVLTPGMTLAIEPMVNAGTWQVVQNPDGWTYRTKDGSLSAHFEHTIAVTNDGCEILTLRESPGKKLRRTVEKVKRAAAPEAGRPEEAAR